MFIDTHTHLYDDAFPTDEEKDAAVRRALDAGVGKMVIPDENSGSRDAVFKLCSRWPGVCYPCIGIHPTEIGPDPEAEKEALIKALEERRGYVAIGEIGLDCYWTKENIEIQKDIFRFQLEIALERDLPVIIHNREATDDILTMLEPYAGKGLRGVIHAFSGSIETFRRIDALGSFFTGIGGVLTFKNASIAKTVSEIPLEKIILETDSPYLTPVPHRGERNESAYVVLTARFLAERKACPVSLVEEITARNAVRLFGLEENS